MGFPSPPPPTFPHKWFRDILNHKIFYNCFYQLYDNRKLLAVLTFLIFFLLIFFFSRGFFFFFTLLLSAISLTKDTRGNSCKKSVSHILSFHHEILSSSCTAWHNIWWFGVHCLSNSWFCRCVPCMPQTSFI